ncbi:Hypothetical protein GbCGDNIH3_5069 [Granulibacter bethesdensis]|uniref:Uncharacterized protein n=1 Tax=Granulibacter bethesdensis TaxID=364410 RepID=A0AAN0VG22_9PROT|nr:Hypothetical protein GbCGDNIH3_5069 [Granulibacter bethesdensis]
MQRCMPCLCISDSFLLKIVCIGIIHFFKELGILWWQANLLPGLSAIVAGGCSVSNL